MSNVGYATLNVIPSAKGFGKTLTGQVSPAMASAGAEGGNIIGSTVGKIAGPLLAAAGIASMGLFVAGAVKQAGALEQSMGAIDTVFKGSAAQMHEWSASASTSVGLAKNDYNELAVLIGSQLKNAGTPMDELAGKTNGLVSAGADMASMFGGTTKEAVEAISSALKGERDPIERYGVSLNEAKIQAKMAEDAMNGVTYASEEQAKAAATLALIMEQTADANGNFARESQTYEGVMQRLGASWENVTTTIGQGFLPIATAGGSILLGMMPSIQGVADKFAALAPAIQGVVEVLLYGNYDGGLFAAFSGLSEDSGFIDFLFNVREAVVGLVSDGGDTSALAGLFSGVISSAAGWVATGLAAAQTELTDAVVKGLSFWVNIYAPAVLIFELALLGAVIQVVPQITLALWSAAPGLIGALNGILPGLLASALTLFQGLVSAALSAVSLLVTALVGILPALTTPLLGMLPNLIAAALELFLGIITGLVAVQPIMLGAVVSLLPALLTAVLGMLPSLVDAALTLFLGVVTAIVTLQPILIAAVLDILPMLITTLLGMLPTIIESALTLFLGVVTGLLTAIPQVIVALLGMLPQLLSTVIGMIPQLIQAAVQLFKGIVSAIPKVLPLIIDALITIGPQLVSTLIDMVPLLVQAGADIISGLVGGLWNASSGVVDALLSIAGNAVDAFKNFLGIHSPSRLLADYGTELGNHLADHLAATPLDQLAETDVTRDVAKGGVLGSIERQAASLAKGDTWNIHGADDAHRTAAAITGLTAEQELQRAWRALKYTA